MPTKVRRPLISGNWKMNMNHYEAIHLVQKLSYLLNKQDFEKVDVSVHPPFTDIRSVQTVIDSDKLAILLGAQNCHCDEKGALTGEVSPAFLGKLGVKYVICGHSERRQIFGETDEFVAAKVAAIFTCEMLPIMCVGETRQEREAGITLERVDAQIKGSMKGRSAEQVAKMVIAYEPIWAIGTGLTATAQDAQTVCAHIRSTVGTQWGAAAADSVRIQYGGSVKAGNVAELMAQPDIDGALVGGASIDPDEFARIVQYHSIIK